MSDDDHRMTVVQHLEELRRVLIMSMIAWAVGMIIAFTFNGWLLHMLLRPLMQILPKANHLLTTAIFTSPTEGLSVPLKVAAISGFILALPVILWQVWTFVSPGLRPAERKFAGPFIVSALVLFGLGAAFAYFIMPLGLNFLATFLNGDAVYFPDISEYLSFLVLIIVIFGVTFELPIAIILLGMLGIVSSRWLRTRRRAVWLGIIIVSFLVTPGADPFTPTALAIPLIVFFEAAVIILDRVLKR